MLITAIHGPTILILDGMMTPKEKHAGQKMNGVCHFAIQIGGCGPEHRHCGTLIFEAVRVKHHICFFGCAI